MPRVRTANGSWHLNSKALFDREQLRDLQTSYAKAMEPLGLRRGEPGSEAKHTEVKQFYGAVQSAKRLAAPPAKPALPPMPPKPIEPASTVRKLAELLASAIGWETAHQKRMRSYGAALSKWRVQARGAREQEGTAWEQLRTLAAVAPLERRRKPVPPGMPTASHAAALPVKRSSPPSP